MVFAATLAHSAGLIDAELLARHRHVLELAGLPTRYPQGPWLELRDAMNLDKKSRGSSLRFVVLGGLGMPRILQGSSEGELADEMSALRMIDPVSLPGES